MNIPEDYIIHDTRVAVDFKGVSICGYKRLDVVSAYQNAMMNNKLEDSIRWCAELHSTGLNAQIWSSIYNIYFKYIHINHPKFFIYFLKREREYYKIINNYPKRHEIFTRNNQEIRNLLCEITSIAALTKKNNLFLPKSLPKVGEKDFAKENIQKRMISRNLDELNDFIYNTTTNEMKIGLNEILINLGSKRGTFENCLYWYLWLEKVIDHRKKEKVMPSSNQIIFETWKINKVKKIINGGEEGENGESEQSKYFDSWVYIIWDIILYFYENLDKNNAIYLKKIHNLYKKNFKLTQISSKKYYIFIAFYIIKKNINWNANLYPIEYLIIQTNANINSVYKNIILNLESNLSKEMKERLYKKYYEIFFQEVNKSKGRINGNLTKIKDTSLDKDLNTIVYSKHGGYIKKESKDEDDSGEGFAVGEDNYEDENDEENDNDDYNSNNSNQKNNLVYKNKTGRDVLDGIEDKKLKKLSAFADLITYKSSVPKERTDLDLDNSNNDNNILKEIQFSKKYKINN